MEETDNLDKGSKLTFLGLLMLFAPQWPRLGGIEIRQRGRAFYSGRVQSWGTLKLEPTKRGARKHALAECLPCLQRQDAG